LGGLAALQQSDAYHGAKHARHRNDQSEGVEYAPRAAASTRSDRHTIDTTDGRDMLEGQADAMAEIMKQQSIGRLGRARTVAAAVLWLEARARVS